MAIALGTYKSSYYIKPSQVTLMANDQNNPSLVYVGVRSGTYVEIYYTDRTGATPEQVIGYGPNSSYQKWQLSGSSTKLASNAKHYIYIRLRRTEKTAMLIFSTRLYDFYGKNVDGVNHAANRELYYYILAGELTATDGTNSRELTFQTGNLSTPENSYDKEEADSKFMSFAIADQRYLNQVEDDTAKGVITFLQGIKIGSWEGENTAHSFQLRYDETLDSVVLSRTDGKPAHFLATGALSTRALGNIKEEGTGGGMDYVYNVYDFSKALDTFNEVSETDTFNAYSIRLLYEMVKTIENSSTDTSYVDGKIEEVNNKIDTNTAYLSEWIERVEDTLQENIDAVVGDLSTLQNTVNDFLTGTDTDTIINRWKELESFLNGYTETATLADLLSGKADKATTLAGYGITNAYTKTEVDGKISSFNTDLTTLQSYFTNGVANSALRLSGGAEYKAWGQVFFKDGKPVNVSGEGTFTQVNADSVLFGGKARLAYNSTLDALLLTKDDGTVVHFLASGAVATRGLGEIESGGGGTGTGVDLLNIPSDIIPSVGGTYNLGSSANAWKMIYANGGIIGNTYIDSARVIFGTYIQGQSWVLNPDGSASFSSLTINGANAATQNWVNSQDFAKISDLLSIPSDIIPSVGVSYSLGTSGKPWKELFVGDIQSENIMPSSHYTYSLGADENRWSKIYGVDIYATRFTMNGEPVATRNWVNSQEFVKTSDLISVASDIIPDGNLTRKLGSSDNRWSLLYVNSISAGGIMPRTDDAWDIGASNSRWRRIYAVNGYFDNLTINNETAATQTWVTTQIDTLTNGGTINNATLTGDVTGNGWSIEGGIANFGEVNTDSLYINGEGVLTSSSLANYVTLNSAQTISGMKTFTGGITASHLYSVEYLDSSELTINAEEVNFTYHGDDANLSVGLLNGYKPLTLGNTSFSPALTSGTVIGTITIGGESKTIFAPNGGNVTSGGKINLVTVSAATISSYMASVGDDGIKMFIVTDSNGNIPSLNGETSITVSGTAKLLLFGKSKPFGVSVGDILAVTKLQCRIIPLNDAKAANGDFPGADGLETVWDKTQINKIAGIEYTANAALPRTSLLPSSGVSNMNDALETGIYVWCTLGRPSGATGAFTCVVHRSSTPDFNNFYTIEQTAYGREAELGQVYKRIIFWRSDEQQYGEWVRVDNTNSADLSNYVTLDSEQTITGSKYFSDLNANSIYLQGFELKPYNPDGSTPDRLMYDGYVLLDEYNYSEYLDSAYVKKSGGTVTGKLGFSGGTYPQIYGDGNYLSLSPASDGLYGLTFDKPSAAIRARADKNTQLGTPSVRWYTIYSDKGNFSGQITSTVADGTSPFVVASKTEVANLHSATATKLHIPRTLWGHPFDGSSNISGSLGGVTTITGVSSSSLLIHSSGSQAIGLAYNGDGTKAVALDNSSFRPYSSANGLLDLGSSSARWKGIYGQSLGLSGGATIGGSLSLANNAPEILFYREGESSWKILNYSNGNFYIQNNYTTEVQSSYFTVLQLNRNTGNATLKGSLTTGGNILPSVTKTLNLGQADKRWNVYAASLSAVNVTSSLTPDVVDSRDLGSTDLPWYCGYIDYLSPKEIWFNDDEEYSMRVENSSLVVTSKLAAPSIMTDELSSSTSQYISVKAMSLDLYECELYGYNSDNLDVWNVDFAGNAWFLSVTQTSDVRYKNIKENIHLELSDIAAAPTFKFAWANDTDGITHIGTSAQYWQEIAGELVTENKKTGKLGLDYSTAALVSAVSIAREVNTMKMWQTSTTDRIEELEDKVKKLEEENKALRELLNSK